MGLTRRDFEASSTDASTNKFNTIYLRRKNEPLSNPGNLFLAAVETHEPMVASDEYCHEKSARLRADSVPEF